MSPYICDIRVKRVVLCQSVSEKSFLQFAHPTLWYILQKAFLRHALGKTKENFFCYPYTQNIF